MPRAIAVVDATSGPPDPGAVDLVLAAGELGEVTALVVGALASGETHDLGTPDVRVLDMADDGAGLADAVVVQSVVDLVRALRPSAVALPAGLEGTRLAARLASRLEAGAATDVSRLWFHDGRVRASKSVLGSRFTTTVEARCPVLVCTMRPQSHRVSTPSDSASISHLTGSSSAAGPWPRLISWAPTPPQARPPLGTARTVVAAGRGLAGHATLAEDLADVLGAAVGATRALVDEGVYPQSLQIGQTGATVSPDVYIALGIAGAVQHMSGAMGASHIVAINNDPEAPIHALADLSVVGDATVVVPRLVEALRSRPSPDGTALP